MGDSNHAALTAEDDITVVFRTADSHRADSDGDHDECGDRDERTAERIHLRSSCRVSCDCGDGDARGTQNDVGGEPSLGDGERNSLCPGACCVRSKATSRQESAREDEVVVQNLGIQWNNKQDLLTHYRPQNRAFECVPALVLAFLFVFTFHFSPGLQKLKTCPGLGLFYALLSTVFFSIIALLVKTIQGIHAIEISTIRCFFQMLFIVPLLIYHKTGFLGPRDKRLYLVLRGFFGSNAMILLFYAVQQMPLADATVIMFSNPVFTSLLAWIFLKERCTIWDCVFTVFTITGVILIARPPFIFGDQLHGIEGNYTNHIKGTIAAFAGAIGAALTMVVLRKIGKSAHYYLSVWYYTVIGLIECIITMSVLGEWKLPSCGRDRWMLMLIAVLGIAGQIFLTKALQIEKAGPVALMRTVDVMLAFIFQFIFFDRAPTLWSLGGALCIVASTSGVALRKWYINSRKT